MFCDKCLLKFLYALRLLWDRMGSSAEHQFIEAGLGPVSQSDTREKYKGKSHCKIYYYVINRQNRTPLSMVSSGCTGRLESKLHAVHRYQEVNFWKPFLDESDVLRLEVINIYISHNRPSRNTTTLLSLLCLFCEACFACACCVRCRVLTATPDANIYAAVSATALSNWFTLHLLSSTFVFSTFPSFSVQCCPFALPINFSADHNRKSLSDPSFAEHILFATGGLWCCVHKLGNFRKHT